MAEQDPHPEHPIVVPPEEDDKPEGHPDHPHGGPPGQTGEHPHGGPPGQDKPEEKP